MILINLIPDEYAARGKSLPIPLRGIATVALILLIIIWVFILRGQRSLKSNLSLLTMEMNALFPQLDKAETLIRKMNDEVIPKKNFIEKFNRPDSQGDLILNLISDAVPEGVWLNALKLSGIPDFDLRIEGFAMPDRAKSSVGVVSDFATQVKKRLEERMGRLLDTAPVPLPVSGGRIEGSPSSDSQTGLLFNVETFTQQQDWNEMSLTQFVLEFRRK